MDLRRWRACSGVLLGPEDFLSQEEGHSLEQARARPREGVSALRPACYVAGVREVHWEANSSWLPIQGQVPCFLNYSPKDHLRFRPVFIIIQCLKFQSMRLRGGLKGLRGLCDHELLVPHVLS